MKAISIKVSILFSYSTIKSYTLHSIVGKNKRRKVKMQYLLNKLKQESMKKLLAISPKVAHWLK